MNSHDGFFELHADNLQELKSVLVQHPSIEKIEEEEGRIIAYPKTQLSASDLNKFLFERNITLSHLVKRKHSLEEQFLELTNNN